jgi:hypothetical protein
VWTATGQLVNYANWRDSEPRFKEGEGQALLVASASHKMLVDKTSLNREYNVAHYICERNAFVNGARSNQMKQKPCSAGSDWTCRNEVTGCYCHQTINVNRSFALFDNPRIDLFHAIDRGIGRMPPSSANPSG